MDPVLFSTVALVLSGVACVASISSLFCWACTPTLPPASPTGTDAPSGTGWF